MNFPPLSEAVHIVLWCYKDKTLQFADWLKHVPEMSTEIHNFVNVPTLNQHRGVDYLKKYIYCMHTVYQIWYKYTGFSKIK